MILLIFLIACISLTLSVFYFTVKEKRNTPFLVICSAISLILFIVGLYNHSTPHSYVIDPFVDPCYSPISYKDAGLLIIMHLFSIISIIFLYVKGLKLPPILFIGFIFFLLLGMLLNYQFLNQISFHDTSRINYNSDVGSAFMFLYPILLLAISTGILTRLIKSKAKINEQKEYSNRWLNTINKQLLKIDNLPIFAIWLSIPIMLILILILVLFGQDVETFNKVYTETATWKLSQHLHPPTVDDKHGHYLCTVAALGSPYLVKPSGIGLRGGKYIIVNRQLQIANAFEFMIEQISPKGHRLIRRIYDNYGLNLSRRINKKSLSNITYLLMKPLEWIFLISLYSYYTHPETIIESQYKTKHTNLKSKV